VKVETEVRRKVAEGADGRWDRVFEYRCETVFDCDRYLKIGPVILKQLEGGSAEDAIAQRA
jgi:hypothetical protein